ncbi:MAG: hypothetical protein ACRDO8_01225, partial [Nocardioidaceae bacterium]
QQVKDAIAASPVDLGGVGVDQVLGWLRVVLMVVAAAAAAGVVLAVWTAKGHRGARLVLSVLAGGASVAFLATGVLGLLPAALAVGTIVYLWSKESRAWFAGEEPPPARQSSPRQQSPWQSSSPRPPAEAPPPVVQPPEDGQQVVQPPEDGPRPSDRPFGVPEPPAPPQGRPGTWPQPGPWQPGPHPRTGARPRSIVLAVVVTSVMAGLVGLVCGANALMYLLSPSDYTQLLLDQPMMQEQVLEELGISASELSRFVFIGAAVCCVLAAAAIGAALLMLRRLPAARIGLTVVTGLAIALSVVAFPFGLVWAVGEIFVLVQIYRVDANAWFSSRR